MAAPSPRSVVWVGGCEGLMSSHLVASPLIDVAWCPTVAEALRLPLSAFDVVVLPGRCGVEKLRAAGARVVLMEQDPDPRTIEAALGPGVTSLSKSSRTEVRELKEEEVP